MASLPIYDMSKKKIGNIDLNDAIFAAEVKPYLIHDVVRAQVAWHYERKTANSRTRTEVQGTRKKIYRQKGTGQARHGDAKAPIFVGGGKAHGPRPRIVHYKINKKVMRTALISALSMHQKGDRLFVVDKLALDKLSAKSIAGLMKSFGLQTALFVNARKDTNEQLFNRSTANITGTKWLAPEGLNVFDILKYKNLILSRIAVEQITERLSR